MSCEKVTMLVEKSKESSLSLREILKLKFHLRKCTSCSKYDALSRQFDFLFKNMIEKEDATLQLSEKKRLEILKLVKSYSS